MRAAIVLAAGLVVGCTREGDVAAPAVAAPQEPARAPARAPVRSCAASEPPREVKIDPRIDIGVAGGASRLFGYADFNAVLIGLGPAGELATTPVPLQNAQIAATVGDRIFLYAPREGEDVPARWLVVDVADPDAPRIGTVTPVGLAATYSYASAFAVGQRRAALVYGLNEEAELATLDTATGAVVGKPARLERDLLPVKAFCAEDRCAVVAIRDESGGPARRLVVVRAGADGSIADELIGPDWVGQAHVVEAGDRVFVQWDGFEGLRVRALDRAGRPLGPAVGPEKDPSRRLHAGELLSGLAPPVLAIGEQGRWSVAALAADATPGAPRVLDGAAHYFLIGATLDDGLAWASISGDVDYEQLGDSGPSIHSWRTKITAGFAGDDGPASHAELFSEGGPGRGGYGAWVLVRPGRAAVLAVPQGDARQFGGKARLFSLRAPCPER